MVNAPVKVITPAQSILPKARPVSQNVGSGTFAGTKNHTSMSPMTAIGASTKR